MALAIAPAAIAEVEPNNSVFDADGPVVGGQDVAGALTVGEQHDWYVLYADGVRQLHLTSTDAGPSQCYDVDLTNDRGQRVARDYTTPSGTTRFFVHVQRSPAWSCLPTELPYSFRVDPAEALVAGPGKLPVKGVAEPNDTRAEARGPLLPDAWYLTSLETVNDRDWLSFYVRPGRWNIDVQAARYGGGGGCGHRVALAGADGGQLASSLWHGDPLDRLEQRVTRGAQLFLLARGNDAEGCKGVTTAFQVGPAEAIMTGAEVRSSCSKGRRDGKRAARRIRSDKRKIARIDGSVPRKLKRKLAKDRRQLKAARRSVATYCP